MHDLSIITDPVSDVYPCGISIRDVEHADNIYNDLKGMRLAAKREERNLQEFCGVNFTKQWLDISNNCIKILSEKSKDIDVFCWLVEAQLRLEGFVGLGDALNAFNVVIQSYWGDLHPAIYETSEERLSAFSALNGKAGNGGLLQALRLAPLVPHIPFGQFGLWDYIKSRRSENSELREQMNNAAFHAGKSAMLTHMETIDRCNSNLRSLSDTFKLYCTDDAPNISDMSDILDQAASAIRDINNANWFITAPAGAQSHSDRMPAEQDHQAENENQLQYQSRDEALAALFSIAAYFRHTEPNSPIAPALDTLVRRSRMDFATLLLDLMPDETICSAVLTASGISLPIRNEE